MKESCGGYSSNQKKEDEVKVLS